MLQKELAKRLKARYDTKMDGNGWMEVSSDGIPLCRIKYNGQFLSNADQKFFDYKAFGKYIGDAYYGEFVDGGFIYNDTDTSLLDILYQDEPMTMGGM